MQTSDKGMKRFVVRLLIFLVLMFILDRGFGMTMTYLQNHARGDMSDIIIIFCSMRTKIS